MPLIVSICTIFCKAHLLCALHLYPPKICSKLPVSCCFYQIKYQCLMTQFLQNTHKFCVFGVETELQINFHPSNETHFLHKSEP